MAVKGKTNNPNGRPKGSGNRDIQRARDVITKFVDDNVDMLQELLLEIREEKGALEAFNCVEKLLEYTIPKLSRAEVKHEGGVTINSLLADMDDPDRKRD